MDFYKYTLTVRYEALQEYMTQMIAALEYQKTYVPKKSTNIDQNISYLLGMKKNLKISIDNIDKTTIEVKNRSQTWNILQVD